MDRRRVASFLQGKSVQELSSSQRPRESLSLQRASREQLQTRHDPQGNIPVLPRNYRAVLVIHSPKKKYYSRPQITESRMLMQYIVPQIELTE